MVIREIVNWAKEKGFQFDFFGNLDTEITGFSSNTRYRPDTITWIKKSFSGDTEQLKNMRCVVVQKGVELDVKNQIISSDSKELFFAIIQQFYGRRNDDEPIGAGSVIRRGVKLSEGVRIGCNCVLAGNIRIGSGTVIEHNVTILNDVEIGADCIIHSGAIVGTDGFGFSFNQRNIPVKVPHFGGVIIGNRVEIGSGCVVNRGTIDSTIIKDDVKIDSLVLVAHNVEIGEATIIVGGVTIGGSCKIGTNSYIAPQAIIRNQKTVGNNSFVGQAVIVNDSIGDNVVLATNEGRPIVNRDYRRFL